MVFLESITDELKAVKAYLAVLESEIERSTPVASLDAISPVRNAARDAVPALRGLAETLVELLALSEGGDRL